MRQMRRGGGGYLFLYNNLIMLNKYIISIIYNVFDHFLYIKLNKKINLCCGPWDRLALMIFL